MLRPYYLSIGAEPRLRPPTADSASWCTFPPSEARRVFKTMASSDFFGKLVVVP